MKRKKEIAIWHVSWKVTGLITHVGKVQPGPMTEANFRVRLLRGNIILAKIILQIGTWRTAVPGTALLIMEFELLQLLYRLEWCVEDIADADCRFEGLRKHGVEVPS
jgi:hypothetical protein